MHASYACPIAAGSVIDRPTVVPRKIGVLTLTLADVLLQCEQSPYSARSVHCDPQRGTLFAQAHPYVPGMAYPGERGRCGAYSGLMYGYRSNRMGHSDGLINTSSQNLLPLFSA
jgi:hypothetical protein